MKGQGLNHESTKKSFTLISAILTLLFFNLSWGIETISLKEILNEVLKKNPEILASKKMWEAKGAMVPASWSLDDPMIGIMWQDVPNSFNLGQSIEKIYTLQQNVPFPPKLLAQRKVSLSARNSFEQEYNETSRRVLAQVKSTYYQYFFTLKNMEIFHHHLEILTDFSKIIQTQYMVGKASQPDVLKIQVELSLLNNELLDLDRKLVVDVSMLNIFMNRAVNSPLHQPEEVTKDSLKYDLAQLLEMAKQTRAQIKAVQYQLEKTQAQANLAKWNYAPDFMLRLGRINSASGFRGWDFEVQASVPLWFLQKENYELKAAQREKENLQAMLNSVQNMVALEVQDAFVKLKTKDRIFELYKNSIWPQAKQSLEAATSGYQTQKVDFLTLLESERDLRHIELGYYQALVDYQEAFAHLEQAVGLDLRE